MSIEKKKTKPKKKPIRKRTVHTPSKLNAWMKYYTDNKNTVTFMCGSESAKAAGYKCKDKKSFSNTADQIKHILSDRIKMWLDEEGLSETALKNKLFSLLEIEDVKILSAPVMDESGKVVDFFVKKVEIPAIETQRKALDMGLKVKGMYAPKKYDVVGPPPELNINFVPVEKKKK